MILCRFIAHVEAQNWTAAGLDFVIVVTGVFIGIQVSNWNDDRALRERERVYLEQLLIDLESDRATAYHWIGILYTSMGYVERGEKAIARAAELEPGNANLHGEQSVLLARSGAREDAMLAALQQARLGNSMGHAPTVIRTSAAARLLKAGLAWPPACSPVSN
jgi:hypothetical protein